MSNKLSKTHRAILERAIKESAAPLKLEINAYSDKTYVAITYADNVIANGLVGKEEENKTSAELLSYLLGGLLWWSYRGKSRFDKIEHLL